MAILGSSIFKGIERLNKRFATAGGPPYKFARTTFYSTSSFERPRGRKEERIIKFNMFTTAPGAGFMGMFPKRIP